MKDIAALLNSETFENLGASLYHHHHLGFGLTLVSRIFI